MESKADDYVLLIEAPTLADVLDSKTAEQQEEAAPPAYNELAVMSSTNAYLHKSSQEPKEWDSSLFGCCSSCSSSGTFCLSCLCKYYGYLLLTQIYSRLLRSLCYVWNHSFEKKTSRNTRHSFVLSLQLYATH